MKIYDRYENLLFEDNSITMKETVENAVKKGVSLIRADLSNTNLQGVNLERVDLYNASLCNANLECANLYNVILRCAFLQKTNLQGANLKYAFLREASLEEADLQGANLEGANLEGAYLRDANLKYANLQNVEMFNNYILIKQEEYEQLKGTKDVSEISKNFVMENLSSNIINKKENIEYLIKGVVEIIKENLLKDEDFK